MSESLTALDQEALLRAFEVNDFDIAGLADYNANEQEVNHCLQRLYRIISSGRDPDWNDKTLLAQVLFAMIEVARSDYASDGHQEYWPFLFERIKRAAFADPGMWGKSLSGQASQDLLGRAFRTALTTFNYGIPNEGQKFVAPIVFHAGIPHTSLPGVLKLIAAACEQFGPLVVSLDADVRRSVVEGQAQLHRNVERLLSSNLLGASQLWGCLARVVLAWRMLGDCTDELEQLPPALDPERVRAALPRETETAKLLRIALPQLRYDVETGEIVLKFPAESSTNWDVELGKNAIPLAWSRTHLGRTAEFRGPLPAVVSVKPIDAEAGFIRTFSPSPQNWPGYWFHTHNGNLEDGATIDANGLAAGRWYVVFEGTPTVCSVPYVRQVPLKFSWFQGNGNWTAWEVEVPTRSPEQSALEWSVGENVFEVPLTRRSGAKVEPTDEPVVQATTPDGSRLDVFSAAPRVILRRDQPISVQILRETTDSVAVLERLELQPARPTRLPVERAGVYQLREARGVGRTLLRFAVVPGLQIAGPEYGPRRITASLTISADKNAGLLCDAESHRVTEDRGCRTIHSSTEEPILKVQWCWQESGTPPLVFRWPLEALRWRVTHAGDESTGWTREPIFIRPKTVAEHDAQLEIQVPAGSELAINGDPFKGKFQSGPFGDTAVLSLMAYGEVVELQLDGDLYAAVIKSDRPLIDEFHGIADEDCVIVTWQTSDQQARLVMAAWDPCDILAPPKTFPLSEGEWQSGEWSHACRDLPGRDWTVLTPARSAGGFFQKTLHLAARRVGALEPASLLLDRSTGQCQAFGEDPDTWIGFLHEISISRWYRREIDADAMGRRIAQIGAFGESDFSMAIRLQSDLERLLTDPAASEHDRRWAEPIHRAVDDLVRHFCRENPVEALRLGDAENRFSELLEMGIPVGRTCPFRWFTTQDLPPDVPGYPLGYIRDLWLLGTDPKSLPSDSEERQLEAGGRVLRFHNENDLPALSNFLSLAGRTATLCGSDKGHRHSFAIPLHAGAFKSVDELCEVLGLQDKAIDDCEATCEDQHFSLSPNAARMSTARQNQRYSLYWCADESRWQIDFLNINRAPLCCYGSSLIVELINPVSLATSSVRPALERWTRGERFDAKLTAEFSFLDKSRGILVGDAVSGPLHADLLNPGKTEFKELFGKQVAVETRSGLSPLAMIAWQLAWIERTTAWENTGGGDGNSSAQREFLSGLAKAVKWWPTLMRRTIALAELTYWTLQHGGLGVSAKFHGSQIDEESPTGHESHSSRRQTFAVAKFASAPAGDRADGEPGIIVGYDGGVGVVLLRGRSFRSLDAALEDYRTYGDGEHWFATFHWKTLDEADRDHFQQERAKTSGERQMLADVMCGFRVTCNLRKKLSWEAATVIVELSKPRATISRHHRRKTY